MTSVLVAQKVMGWLAANGQVERDARIEGRPARANPAPGWNERGLIVRPGRGAGARKGPPENDENGRASTQANCGKKYEGLGIN
jgi:hypothetical protein